MEEFTMVKFRIMITERPMPRKYQGVDDTNYSNLMLGPARHCITYISTIRNTHDVCTFFIVHLEVCTKQIITHKANYHTSQQTLKQLSR